MGFGESDPHAYVSGLPLNVPLSGLYHINIFAGDIQRTYQIALVEDILPIMKLPAMRWAIPIYRCSNGKELAAEPFVRHIVQ